MFNTINELRDAYATKRITKKDAEQYAKARANAMVDPAKHPTTEDFVQAMAWMNLDLSDIKPAEKKPDPTVGDYADIMAERAFFLQTYADAILNGEVWPDNMPEAMLADYPMAVRTSADAFKLGDDFTASQAWTDKQLRGFVSRKLQGGHLARIAARNADKGHVNNLADHLAELAEADELVRGDYYKTDDLHRVTSQYTDEEVNHDNRSMRLPRWSSVAARGKTGNLTGWKLIGYEGTRAGKPTIADQRLVYMDDEADHETSVFATLEAMEGWLAEVHA